MEYSGATSIFMKILLDKKYALPFRVVDAIVDHFASFTVSQISYHFASSSVFKSGFAERPKRIAHSLASMRVDLLPKVRLELNVTCPLLTF